MEPLLYLETTVYAVLLASLVLLLGFNVVRHRLRARVSIGVGEDTALERACRAHGNACENIPLLLVLMLIAEFNHAPAIWIHGIGCLMIIGRVTHALVLLKTARPHPGRVVGMVLTWLSLALAIGLLAIQVR